MSSTSGRLGAIVAAAIVSSAAHAAVSSFDVGSEGWLAEGDAQGPLSWSAVDGNPGGHVFINDQTIGGVTYFRAPAKFLGDQSAALATNLTFDLKQTFPGGANQFNGPDVVLMGNGLTLAYDTADNPARGAWTSYSVLLSATGWKLNTLAGADASDEQFESVLANLTSLAIRAEYQTGSDTGYLDNVSIFQDPGTPGSVPEPGTAGLLALGAGGLALAARRKRQAKA